MPATLQIFPRNKCYERIQEFYHITKYLAKIRKDWKHAFNGGSKNPVIIFILNKDLKSSYNVNKIIS